MKTLATAVCAGTITAALFAQTAAELTTPEVFQTADGETLNYRIYLPANIPAGKRVPLVLFFHGAGERGDDNTAQLKHGVTGVSMGGYGTWDAIQRKPGLFAAAIPICGGGDSARAQSLKNIPIWVFHGDKDTAVPVTRSRDMVNALNACGGKVQYREYPGAGHDVWTRTYADTSVLAWLFAQRRSGEPQASRTLAKPPAKTK